MTSIFGAEVTSSVVVSFTHPGFNFKLWQFCLLRQIMKIVVFDEVYKQTAATVIALYLMETYK